MRPEDVKVGARVKCVFADTHVFGMVGTITELDATLPQFTFETDEVPTRNHWRRSQWSLASSFDLIDDSLPATTVSVAEPNSLIAKAPIECPCGGTRGVCEYHP